MEDGELERILKALQEGLKKANPNQKITVGEQNGAFFIDRRPKEEPQYYVAPDLSNAVDWFEKFKREREGFNCHAFNDDEYIVVQGIINKQDGEYKLGVDVDPRMMDFFTIKDNKSKSSVEELVAQPVKAIIKINSNVKKEFQVSDIQEYNCSLEHVISSAKKNPKMEDIAKMNDNERVTIEGEFLGYSENAHDSFLKSLGYSSGAFVLDEGSVDSCGIWEFEDEYPVADFEVREQNGKKTKHTMEKVKVSQLRDEKTRGIIRTLDGRIIEVAYSLFRTRFNGGEFDNIEGKVPVEGDFIKMTPSIRDGKIVASECDSCYLVAPSKKRLELIAKTSIRFTNEMNSIIDSVKTKEYKSAREGLAELNKVDLKESEKEVLNKVVGLIPNKERPLLVKEGDDWARNIVTELDTDFNISVESFSKKEFKDYVTNLPKKEIPEAITKYGAVLSTSYFLDLMSESHFNFSERERESVIDKATGSWLKRIRGNDKNIFYERYAFETSLERLAGVGTASSTEKYFDYLKSAVDNNEYMSKKDRENNLSKEEKLDHVFFMFQKINSYKSDMDADVLKKNLSYLEVVSEDLKTKDSRGDSICSYFDSIKEYVSSK